jgi:hypothetical protein
MKFPQSVSSDKKTGKEDSCHLLKKSAQNAEAAIRRMFQKVMKNHARSHVRIVSTHGLNPERNLFSNIRDFSQQFRKIPR